MDVVDVVDVVDAVGAFNMFSEFVSLGGRFKEISMLEQRSFLYVRFGGIRLLSRWGHPSLPDSLIPVYHHHPPSTIFRKPFPHFFLSSQPRPDSLDASNSFTRCSPYESWLRSDNSNLKVMVARGLTIQYRQCKLRGWWKALEGFSTVCGFSGAFKLLGEER